MLRKYPELSYEPCGQCGLPVPSFIRHTCEVPLLSGQTWMSLNQSFHRDTQFWSLRCTERAQIAVMTVWQSSFANGLQITFQSISSNVLIETETICGDHHNAQPTRITLSTGEYIVKCDVRIRGILDQLHFQTSKGNAYTFGEPGGGHVSLEIPEGMAVVGLFGDVGGHIHNLGVYLDSIANLSFERRRIYFLVRYKGKCSAQTQDPAEILLWLTPDTFRAVLQFL